MKASKLNFVGRMQRWMDSVPGQTFLNYAYSWGASIVILGALFKLTHMPLANLMLYVGMGTEVFVFFLSAFDRPFDKSEVNRELPEEFPTDEEEGMKENKDNLSVGQSIQESYSVISSSATSADGTVQGRGIGNNSSTIIIGNTSDADGKGNYNSVGKSNENIPTDSEGSSIGIQQAAVSAGITATNLSEIIRMANEELLRRAQASMTPEMEQASKQYVEKLTLLTETLDRVERQSARLTTDSEEMTNLNRTLTGINTIYELQLKSISQQVGSIDQINEQTRRMAQQIEELNGIYSRMIKALTVNMKNATGTGAV